MPNPPFAKIIFDVPASEDAFGGQGHDRSAKALSESIHQIAEQTDGAIGLEGAWGSGKSTVIKIAADKLNESQESPSKKRARYEVFTFDLWTHHADDFRRAFLEEFVSWLAKKHLIKGKEEKKQRGIIRNRIKSVDTENRKTYSPLGIVAIVALPFLPLLYAWIGPVALKDQPPVFNGYSGPEILLRLLIVTAALPIVVFVATVLVDWIVVPAGLGVPVLRKLKLVRSDADPAPETQAPSKFSELWAARPSLEDEASEVFSIFSRETRKNTVTEAIRDEDPSTVEFYGVFRDLLNLVQSHGCRVVFVLDNIDRLPASTVPATWTEIRSVFAADDARRTRPNAKVTAVVPYDRVYVDQAFSGKNDATKTADGARFAEGDIFNKTFNRIIKVSPPVASDWGSFLELMIDRAMENQLDGTARYKLFRLLQLYYQRNVIHPTPRTIVGFVNEIGAYWTQWGHAIPPESIALFVLFRSKIEAHPDALTDPQLVDDRYLYIVEQPEWRRHFAALSFNVEPSVADHILLGDRIAKALTDTTPEALATLGKLGGFDRIFQQHLTESLGPLAAEDASLLSRAASNVHTLSLADALKYQVWREFARALQLVTTLKATPIEGLDGLLTIVGNQRPQDIAPVAATLRDKINTSDSVDETDFDRGIKWSTRVGALSDVVSSRLGPDKGLEFWAASRIAGNGQFMIGAAAEASRFPVYRMANLTSLPPMGDTQTALKTYLSSDSSAYALAVQELFKVMSLPARVQILSDIGDALRAAPLVEKDSRTLLSIYELVDESFLQTKSDAATVLQKLVADGTLLWYGFRASQSADAATVATFVFLTAKRNGIAFGAAPTDPHIGLGALAPAVSWYQGLLSTGDVSELVLDMLANLVARAGLFPAWLKYAVSDPTSKKMFATVVGKIVDDGKLRSMDTAPVFSDYERIKAALGDARALALLGQLATLANPDAVAAAVPDDKLLTLPDPLLTDLASLGPTSPLADVIARVDRSLVAASRESWLEALNNPADMFRVLTTRRRRANLLLPAHTFMPALQDHIVAVLAGEIKTPEGTVEEWSLAAGAVRESSLATLATNVLTSMPRERVSPATAAEFVEYYPAVADVLPLAAQANQAIDVLLRALVSSDEPTGRAYVRNQAAAFRRALKKVEPQVYESFVDVVEGLESIDDDHRVWAEEVRTLLNVKKRKQEESEIEPSVPPE